MKKLTQKGFGTVEVALILVIVGLVAGVGYYVWKQSKSSPTIENSSASQTTQQSQVGEETEDVPAVKEKSSKTADWKTYSGLDLSLKYPRTWKATAGEENSASPSVSFKSSDYKWGSGPLATLKAGYVFVVGTEQMQAWDSYSYLIKSEKNSVKLHGGSYEEIKIDGNKAIVSDSKPHGAFISASTYKNGKKYGFTLHAVDESKPEVRTLLDDLLSTVRFE